MRLIILLDSIKSDSYFEEVNFFLGDVEIATT